VVKLLRQWLDAGVMDEENVVQNPVTGTPQGGVISRVRERVHERTDVRRTRASDVMEIIATLNPVLRGWGNYFRTGNADTMLNRVDAYVHERIVLWLWRRGGQRRRFRAWKWPPARLHEMGLHRLRGTVRYPSQATEQRPSVSRVREDRTHGLNGGLTSTAGRGRLWSKDLPMRRLPSVVLALLLAALGPASARGQDLGSERVPTREERRRAVELFEQSRYLLRSGEFAEARALLLEAFALHPQPALRIALARAHDGAGDTGEAIAHYEAYLEEEPDAADRGEIESRLDALRARAREEQGTPAPPPPPPPAGPDATAPLVGYALIGFGVAGLAAGGVLAGVAASELDTATRASTTQREALATYGRAQEHGNVAIVLLAGGGALAMAGLVVALVTGESSPPPAVRPGARVLLGLGELSIEGSF
jgi:tetratricopeptide (TPR) repeat protein